LSINFPKYFDPLSFKVTLVGTYSTGKAPKPSNCQVGTGFFFRKDDEKYLITNRHVVIDETQQNFPDFLIIEVHTDKSSLPKTRSIEIPLYNGNKKVWKEHPDNLLIAEPDEKIDVIALRLSDYLQEQDWIDFFTKNDLPDENFLLNLGDSCIIIGYPKGFHDETNYLPIARSGSIASNWGIFFNNRKCFLVDSKLHPGTSGSPVVIPSATSRTDKKGPGIGLWPPVLIGVNSRRCPGYLNLYETWYSELIPEII